MTHVLLAEREDGIAVTAIGHAGYAPAGQDIVCAGISAILYGGLNYLKQLEQDRGAPVRVEIRQGPGLLAFRTSGFADRLDRTVLGVIRAGLFDLADAYPKYVSVRYVKLDQNLHKGGLR